MHLSISISVMNKFFEILLLMTNTLEYTNSYKTNIRYGWCRTMNDCALTHTLYQKYKGIKEPTESNSSLTEFLPPQIKALNTQLMLSTFTNYTKTR